MWSRRELKGKCIVAKNLNQIYAGEKAVRCGRGSIS